MSWRKWTSTLEVVRQQLMQQQALEAQAGRPVGTSAGVRSRRGLCLRIARAAQALRDQRADLEERENAQIAKGIRLKREIGELRSQMRAADAAHQSAQAALEEIEQTLENEVESEAHVDEEAAGATREQREPAGPVGGESRGAEQRRPPQRTTPACARAGGGLLDNSQPHPNITARGTRPPRRLQAVGGAGGVTHWRPGGLGGEVTPMRRRGAGDNEERARAVQEARRLLTEEDGVSHEVQQTRHRTPANRRVRWADDHAQWQQGAVAYVVSCWGRCGWIFSAR